MTPPVVPSPSCVRSLIELSPRAAALGAGAPSLGVDRDLPHRAEIEDEPVVACAEARDGVAAAPDRERQVVLTCEANRRSDVVDAGRPDDQRGTSIVDRVVDGTGLVVLGVAWVGSPCLGSCSARVSPVVS